MFLAVAGIDGSGKSTLVKYLAGALVLEGHAKVRVTYEPGGTNLGKEIRRLLLTAAQNHHETVGLPDDADGRATYDHESAWFAEKPEPLAELLLFAAARAQHCMRIRDWLDAGETVVTDRFSLCTRAYQGARGLRDDIIQQIESVSTGGLKPDVTLLLDIPVEMARGRLFWGRRNMDRFEQESQAYFEKVRSIYLQIAYNDPTVHVIDAQQPIEDVVAQALRIVERHTKVAERKQRSRRRRRGDDDMDGTTKRTETVLRTYRHFQDTGAKIVPKDISAATKDFGGYVGVITVRRVLRENNLWGEKEVEEMRKERWRRINESKRSKGNPSLQKQAEEGYPNLQRARQVLAEQAAERREAAKQQVVEEA
ncbi:MAG: dTMP kinase [Ktedonobacterales bacterium]